MPGGVSVRDVDVSSKLLAKSMKSNSLSAKGVGGMLCLSSLNHGYYMVEPVGKC